MRMCAFLSITFKLVRIQQPHPPALPLSLPPFPPSTVSPSTPLTSLKSQSASESPYNACKRAKGVCTTSPIVLHPRSSITFFPKSPPKPFSRATANGAKRKGTISCTIKVCWFGLCIADPSFASSLEGASPPEQV